MAITTNNVFDLQSPHHKKALADALREANQIGLGGNQLGGIEFSTEDFGRKLVIKLFTAAQVKDRKVSKRERSKRIELLTPLVIELQELQQIEESEAGMVYF